MIHVFPKFFTLPLPAPPVDVPVSPAHYLRLRRCAAGLTIEGVADKLIIRHPGKRAMAIGLLHQLEQPGVTARLPKTLERLRAIFPFDPDVYRQLATEPANCHPRICRGCGVSQWDADEHLGDGPLQWHDDRHCHRHADQALARPVRKRA